MTSQIRQGLLFDEHSHTWARPAQARHRSSPESAKVTSQIRQGLLFDEHSHTWERPASIIEQIQAELDRLATIEVRGKTTSRWDPAGHQWRRGKTTTTTTSAFFAYADAVLLTIEEIGTGGEGHALPIERGPRILEELRKLPTHSNRGTPQYRIDNVLQQLSMSQGPVIPLL